MNQFKLMIIKIFKTLNNWKPWIYIYLDLYTKYELAYRLFNFVVIKRAAVDSLFQAKQVVNS